ncbi:integral membrane sensor signal transduction histidine kinase [Cupriavidus basilensis OR16]|uniref:histidine kinase n=1 Tax=Cupriavidus basilensis OR16 TaxID=1127483 RepID=H1SF67_9BURK|nr:ATP-binding protein [Cupriavidus basilensis]EHP38823.1 integral membrane sensor signal transduction histidine kinase [Cupriavidus basilensis OR16]
MRTIRAQLLAGLLGAVLACALVAGAAAYFKVRREANEVFDAQLQQAARMLPPHLERDATPPLDGSELDEEIVVQAWDVQGHQIYASHTVTLPRADLPGFHDLQAHGSEWRIYGVRSGDRYVQAAQSVVFRRKLAASLSLGALLPILALVPVLGLLIHLVVRRSLRPVEEIARAVGSRSADTLAPLDAHGWPPELLPVVDALNALLDRLQQAMDTQRAFVADAAHELRTPLTALKLQLQLALRAGSEDKQKLALAKLGERLDRTTHLVAQLLTLARSEDGAPATQAPLTDVRLHDVAVQVVRELLPMAEAKDVDLGLDASAPECRVRGVAGDLFILLRNLADNAIRYTSPGGRVDLRIEWRNGAPMLGVSDTGPGIAPAERDNVFRRFHRGDASDAHGSGLGLAIVQSIAVRHGARVLLEDGPAGRGLTVAVVFPPEGGA